MSRSPKDGMRLARRLVLFAALCLACAADVAREGGAATAPHGRPEAVLDWDGLASAARADPGSAAGGKNFSQAALDLDGRQVRVTGFMYPLHPGADPHFLLSATPSICPFCLPAGPDQLIEVEAAEPVAYSAEPLTLGGRFELLRADAGGLFYRLRGALVRDAAAAESAPGDGRTIVLGFDGMDPKLSERWMADGTLPNFARLAKEGDYQVLPTTNPAQSPVAWSSFATGLNPGEHGIFDFLRRNPETYAPEYAISEAEGPQSALRLFGYQLPLEAGTIRNRRAGTPFWISAEREGRPSTVLRVPVTYPADPITRMLSGMGVPDLLGTQGTFTFYTTEAVEADTTGGRVVTVEAAGDRVETTLEGPLHPLYQKPTPLSVPLTIEAAGADRVRLSLDGHALELAAGGWSDWVPVDFGFAGLLGVEGMVRLHLVAGFPELKLYVSPIQLDPRAPAGPISMPADYAADLARRIGLFHTIGMPEETWSLNEERISDQAYLEMVATILKEREAMLFDTLARQDQGLIVAVFVQTDRVSHMFWRGIDPQHPLYARTDAKARGAVKWIYREADRILGRVLDTMKPEDRLIVLSDHGFDSFRRAVHLNRWLVEQGLLVLKPGAPSSQSLFTNVDWPRSKAFALGLNGIFLNLEGREALGVVPEAEAGALKQAIASKLEEFVDPDTGAPVIATVHDRREVYRGAKAADAPDLVIGYARSYRASWQTTLGGVPEALVEDNTRKWSGDHCIEPSFVPGVLFTSFKLPAKIGSITEVPRLVRTELGLNGSVDPAQTAPSMGALDVASPVLAGLDGLAFGWLPDAARVALWGILAALTSMGLYRLISNQRGLAANKAEIRLQQTRLAEYDGPFSGLWPLIGRNFLLAGRQLWLTLVPALIATVPVLLILAFASNAFDARWPAPGDRIEVRAVANEASELPALRWQGGAEPTPAGDGAWNVAWPEAGASLKLLDSDATVLLTLPTAGPASVVHQRRWWNALIGNPAGYLPSPGDVDAVELGLPQPEYLPFGPDWLRGWIAFFFAVVLIGSLLLKYLWRLH